LDFAGSLRGFSIVLRVGSWAGNGAKVIGIGQIHGSGHGGEEIEDNKPRKGEEKLTGR
jgi:hypothetical protein